ncbi:hypothetical protein LBMAG55_00710 [Verrucomicrobiota bacterium]|nr:hypothetical protein EMGBD4_03780 [Verrucomicrobiota bacterium]GDY16748.1 hypothetical protein LBMAG55_00710 [Verrucomicrobiota bacterium]
MNNCLKSMLIAAAALTAVSASAQDKATLDLLVKKGVITAEERAKTLDEAAKARSVSGVNRVFPKEDATKRFTIGGYFQSQYQNFDYSQGGTAAAVNQASQGSFLMRRLYVELTADVGAGISGNLVLDTSGNTSSSSTSWLDRAIVSHTSSIGSFDLGYRKVAWGYEESTSTSLFKASSGKLSTVERGITNRYWAEGENGTAASPARSDGRRLGFAAHHTGLHYNSPANPQGFEYGASVVNSAQGRFTEGTNTNDLAYYANIAWNNKVSDNEAYSVGVNWGTSRYFAATTSTTVTSPSNTLANISGYNPFIMAKYFAWTFQGEYMNTKVTSSKDAVANIDDRDHTPTGYNAMVVYKINDNWEGVARYTSLDTDGRGQKISDGERGFGVAVGNAGGLYDESHALYLGVNYYFNLEALGQQVNGYNAKIQFGFERAEFKGIITPATGAVSGDKATVDAIRLQAQVAF